jgi:TonB-dependent starch-binding outer membrane protein SusC
MIKIILLSLITIINYSVFAQQVVKGTVKDEEGKPLKNVTIEIKNPKLRSKTLDNGTFSINIPSGTQMPITLIFTDVAHQDVTTTWKGDGDVVVSMKIKTKEEDDVVVIGYQTVKRKDLLASVSSVSAKELKDIPINSAAEALNGRLAGVTATTAEGSPDSDIRIRVRGGMSITGDNSPLFIVDGVQIENALNSLSPQDIENIDVLKDAAATAIYGARGANGVVVITTKSGKPGKAKITYNGFYGIKKLASKLNVLSPYEFVMYQYERSRGSSTDSSSFAKNFGTTWDTLNAYKDKEAVDWQDEVFNNNSFTTTHNIGVSGGNKKGTYNFNYTHNNDKAIVLNSNYKRHLINLKGDYKITSKFKVGLGFRYTTQQTTGAGVSDTKGSSYSRLRNAVKYRPFLSAEQEIDEADPLADINVGNGLNLYNPIQLANAEFRKRTNDVFNTTASLSYIINKRWSFKSTFGFDNGSNIDLKFHDSISPYAIIQGGRLPIAQLDTVKRQTITNSNVLTYTLKDFKKKHDFDFLIGQETYDLTTKQQLNTFRNFPQGTQQFYAFHNTNLAVPFAGFPNKYESRYTNLSFFSRVGYAYKDKYLVSANVRADGSSKFGPEMFKKFGYFPSGSIAWRIKKENFLKNVKAITDLKIRAGFGAVGNNRINDYLFLPTFRSDGQRFYGLNNTLVNAYYPSALANTELKWEALVSKNLGLDVSLLNNRISLAVDVYNNQSSDLLLDVPIASTFGYTTQTQNIGKTENKGLEIALNAAIIRKPIKNIYWNSSFNVSFNENKIKQLGKNQTQFFPAASWGVSGQLSDYIVKVGDRVGSIYGLVTDGFYTTNDFDYNTTTGAYTLKAGVVNNSAIIGVVQPGSIKFKDLDGNGLIDVNNDRKIIGNPQPKFTGGFNNQVNYKNFDFSLFVNFSVGGDVYNANKIEFTNGYTNNSNLLDIMQDRWRTVTATGQRAQWVNGSTAYGVAPSQLSALNAGATIWQPLQGSGAFHLHSWAIEDGSFLRFNNATIGYTIPKSKLGKSALDRIRFYFTANNIAVITKYTGYDPEVSVRNNPLTQGLDYSAYPKSRSFIFGINTTF